MGIEIDADFRVNDGIVEFRCPRTWKPREAEEWNESHTEWTSVEDLVTTLKTELEQAG